uniref:ABC transporter permease n=2 Tax=Thermorudis TaxID=1649508 RepID=A0A7C3ARY2_9BACT
MSEAAIAHRGRMDRAGSWRLVLARELADLWLGGKALVLLTLFSILLGVTAYLMATNNELRLIPIKEIAYLMLKLTVAFGIFMSLIIGADSISGERERGTLEGLLLTPTSRRQIVIGKFLAALSPWPPAFVIAIPLIAVLCRDSQVVSWALLWGGILGTILVVGVTGLAMLVSFWSSSNRTSIAVSLIIYLVFLLPTQFPGQAQTGAFGDLLQKWNPLEASNVFLAKAIVNNRSVEEMASWLLAPILFAVLTLGLLFLYASPGLRLEPGRARTRANWGRAASFASIAWLPITLALSFAMTLPTAAATSSESPVQIAVDREWATARTGDEVEFTTLVTNAGSETSPPLIVAMNIINLQGEVVDPEDWSPQRTQSIEPLAAGASIEHTWTIDAILKGDYMVYMVVVPQPAGPESTSVPVASSGIHLTVTPFTRINPRGVLPLAVGIPLGLTASTALLRWRRRRAIAAGEGEA